jgi:hypothetical protein
MKKMKFYIMFSEKLNRPFTDFTEFSNKKTFTLMDNYEGESYTNLRKMTLFKSIEDAQKEKDNMLEYMERDRNSVGKGVYQSYGFKEKDFSIIQNLKIIEFRSI